jgi:hypothetical protein
VIVIDGPKDAALKLYNCLARQKSLGERTHEGFGAFRLDLRDVQVTPAPVKPTAVDQAVSRLETLLAAAEATASALIKPSEDGSPSPSQWMALWQRIQSIDARDVPSAGKDSAASTKAFREALAKEFEAFKKHGESRGGRAWKAVCFKRLGLSAQNYSVDEARLFLDAVIRKQYELVKKSKERAR